MDETSLTLGWLVGRRIAGQRRKPVAYLYNGVELPPLPEWDKETYPYAFISHRKSDGVYELYACSRIPTHSPVTEGDGIVVWYPAQLYLCTDDKSWVFKTQYSEELMEGNKVFVLDIRKDHLWSNVDILNEDGTLCLAASDPIPVYA